MYTLDTSGDITTDELANAFNNLVTELHDEIVTVIHNRLDRIEDRLDDVETSLEYRRNEIKDLQGF